MSRADESRARRAAFHGRRVMSARPGTPRLDAARDFLRAELAHADPATGQRAADEAADAVARVARGLNQQQTTAKGARGDAA